MIITHLGPSILPIRFQFGGAIQRRMIELSRNQAALGHKVIIYSADQQAGTEYWEGVEIRNVVCHRRRSIVRDIEYERKAVRMLERETVDVLHVHGLPEAGFVARRVAARKVLSYDYFIFRRGTQTPLFWWYRRALREFDFLLPVSEYCQQQSTAYWNLDKDRTSVVYNGVNLEQFSPDPLSASNRRRMHGVEGHRVILYVGRVCTQKGTDILIDAYRLVKKRIPEAVLVVAGPPGQFENGGTSGLTRAIVEVGGLYLGAVPDHDLASVYNMCDVFVMPTRALEMFGMAVIEAQACGKPVIVSQHGGLPEVVSRNSGLFFPVGDAFALADRLETLLRDTALWQAKSKAARDNAQRFSWRGIVRQLEGIYTAPRAADRLTRAPSWGRTPGIDRTLEGRGIVSPSINLDSSLPKLHED